MSKGGRSRYARRGEPTSARRSPMTQREERPAPNVKSSKEAAHSVQDTTLASAAPVEPATPPSPAMRWLSAVTRAFPYALIEYVLFLAVVENIPAAAQPIAILLLVVFLLSFIALRIPNPPPWLGNMATWKAMLGEWFGELTSFVISLGLLSVGLMAWAAWHQTSSAIFSTISLLLLLAAMALVVVAHYRHETSRVA